MEDEMGKLQMTVTAISAANGAVLWSAPTLDHGWASEDAARKSWKDRGVRKFFADGYVLDFASLDHTGVLTETSFQTVEA
jgi:hypothetical protein